MFRAAVASVCLFVAPPALAASADLAGELPERFRLACAGTMAADGRESAVSASGSIDLAKREVRGFGVGSAVIVLVTPGLIGFDSTGAGADRLAAVAEKPAAEPRRPAAPVTEGTIRRADGTLRLIVRSASDPARVMIAMTLACRIADRPG